METFGNHDQRKVADVRVLPRHPQCKARSVRFPVPPDVPYPIARPCTRVTAYRQGVQYLRLFCKNFTEHEEKPVLGKDLKGTTTRLLPGTWGTADLGGKIRFNVNVNR